MYEGKFIRIEKSEGKFKPLKRLLGIPIGEGWKKLPVLDHIAVTKVKMSQTLHSARTIGNSSTIASEKLAVFLMGKQKGRRVDAGKFDSLEEALNLAKEMSDYLEIPIKNYVKQ